MQDFLFYVFSSIILVGALLVIASRNTVASAVFMVLSFLGIAGVFVLLEAYFLAVVQVLVYAGAIMVLFLFIIMLLDTDRIAQTKPSLLRLIAPFIGFLLLLMGVSYIFLGSWNESISSPPLVSSEPLQISENLMAFTTSVRSFGYGLFTKYMLPFQVAGILLLIAMVGVLVLSRKDNSDNKDSHE